MRAPSAAPARAGRRPALRAQAAFTLVEALLAIAAGAVLLAALGQMLGGAFALQQVADARNLRSDTARFALERMARAVRESPGLLVPTPDRPATGGVDEATRDPGVLAVRLGHGVDRNRDGIADADNDGDGRVDEDPGGDATFDFAAGVYGVDDDADGSVDEPSADSLDDDEDGAPGSWRNGEDPLNGIDDDGDGLVDEDPDADANGDGAPGVAGVDDDGDGLVDEGSAADDDEDGLVDEDWWDVVVFYLAGSALVERIPVPWDETRNGFVSGRDLVERVIADGVSGFRVTRTDGGGEAPVVLLSLDLTGADGATDTFELAVRAGGGR